eukprot:scaffold8518_cov135-Isochrysis_galbana.AAC.7
MVACSGVPILSTSAGGGSPASSEHLAWHFVSPCCPALGHAGVSATTGFPCRCRSAQRPNEGRRSGARVCSMLIQK